jgi:hypothetical protein
LSILGSTRGNFRRSLVELELKSIGKLNNHNNMAGGGSNYTGVLVRARRYEGFPIEGVAIIFVG